MADLPEMGVSLVVDSTEYERSIDDAISLAADLDDALSDLGGTIDATIDVDSSALDELSDTTVDVDFSVDDSALPFDEIPEETNTDVNITETSDAKQAVDDIHFMALKDKIETIWNIAGNVVDFVKDVGGKIANPFLDVEDAVARINAQTGGTGIADLGQFIRDIQASDLGDSVDQIADVVIAAKQLGAPIDEATRATLTFTHTWTEENPEEVLKTLNTLVETGLVPNLQAASDLMTVFFQEGGNKANDALGVVEANAQSWSDMGINGTQALSAVNSLLDSGVDSATDAAKMIQTLDDALTAAAANADSPQAEALKTLNLENPKDSGQAMGAEFIDGFAGAFTNLPADQQDLISGVLFGKGGKKFTGALEGLTTQGGPFADVIGAAEDAASTIDDSLRGAIDDFVLAVNTKVTELLSSEGIDLPGKIAALKKGFQDAVDVIASGGTIGEALEIGLQIPGLADAINRFEGSIGNFEIAVLELIAGVQETLPGGSTGEETRAEIARLEAQQLPFNLKVANPDEITGEVKTAVARGLSPEDIQKAAGTAVSELLSMGSPEEIERAQTLVDGLKELNAQPTVAPGLNALEATRANAVLAHGDIAEIQAELDAGRLVAPVTIDVEDFQKQIDAAQAEMDRAARAAFPNAMGPDQRAGGIFDFNPTAGSDPLGETFAKRMGMEGLSAAVKTETDGATTAVTDMQTSVNESLTATAADFANTTVAAQLMDTDIAAAMTGNTVTASFEAVRESAETNLPVVRDQLRFVADEAMILDQASLAASGRLARLGAGVEEFPLDRLQAIVSAATAFAGAQNVVNDNSTTTTNVNVTNNNSNGAQTANADYQLGQALGGG